MTSASQQPPTDVGVTLGNSQTTNATVKSALRFRPMVIAVILLGVFFLLQSLIPLRTAVQIGADEGFEMAKATLCLHGHQLYSEVWNDQPPLHTLLITQVLKKDSPTIFGPRLVTTAFAALLLATVFLIVGRASGLLTGALTTALVIASPGFLELSSSCMLEIPALATALAGLGVLLVLPRTKWHAAELYAGVLFGIAALMKLVPLYLLPLAALVLWVRHPESEMPLTPALSPSDGERVVKGRVEGSSVYSALSAVLKAFRGLRVPLLVMGLSLATSFVLIDWLIERGAYLIHFQQSWSSHFGGTQSFEYGSPDEHGFEWGILLKNWDVTIPAIMGIFILITRLRQSRRVILPLTWLALSLIVFTNHKPWWSYYYIHLAIPLCWCAAVGIECVCSGFKRRFFGFQQARSSRGKRVRFNGSRILGMYAPAVLFLLCAVAWMGARVYLQIASVRNSPQLYTALVLKEIERLKPFSHWMYTDQPVYSFHADIPMPPPLAVVPLKRLWTGEMTSARIAAEMSRFKPEIILLRNDSRELPFQELLDAEYRMIYQDEQLKLYGRRAMLRQADAARANELNGANRM